MGRSLTRQIIDAHLEEGRAEAGEPIALRIDQTLTQDATGTLVMLEFEAFGVPRVRTDCSVQYVDHNLLQLDFRNADDHLFLRSAAQKFGLWYSRPGNGVSHPVHMERFGVPGATMLGSDSHTPAAGALGMLAIGSGGLDVALAMTGRPYAVRMPKVIGVRLEGELPAWVSAKDVVLEMLRRRGTDGCTGCVIEYHGPGLAGLSAMDRHVIANMGTEMGATSSVFPSDEAVRRFLRQHGRDSDFRELLPEDDAEYDEHETIEFDRLEPLIARPPSPGDVVPVREVAGESIYQAYIGSSANPGLRDFAVPAAMVDGRRVHPDVSFDVNPTSRAILEELTVRGDVERLLRSGARLHQAGCNGCIGMGQAPASGRNSLRTVPRNFPGRSGTKEDSVFLCSPETATASALRGAITDPRDLDRDPPTFAEPERMPDQKDLLVRPADEPEQIDLVRGPNIEPLPELEPPPEQLRGPVLLAVGDDVSTDEILPAGARVLPLRSNIPAISRFAFAQIDESFADRCDEIDHAPSFVVGGRNYGQGSSREHAALAPRYLGVRCVIAASFARIHRSNLINFGILPLTFADADDRERIEQGSELTIDDVAGLIDGEGGRVQLGDGEEIEVRSDFSAAERASLHAGSLIAVIRAEEQEEPARPPR